MLNNFINRIIVIFFICLYSNFLFSQSNTSKLSIEEKIFGLSLFWSEAKYNFVYFDQVPKLNWDSVYISYIPKVINSKTDFEYFDILQEFAVTLNDGHTSVVYPWSYRRDSLSQTGILTKNIEGKAIVVNVIKTLEKIIPIGSEIIEIDSIPITTFLEEMYPYISSSTDYVRKNIAIEKLLLGKINTSVAIKFKHPFNDSSSTVELVRKKYDTSLWVRPIQFPIIEFKKFDNDIYYLALNTFSEDTLVSMFENILPLITNPNGVIIDLRNNDGGDSRIGLEVLKHFTNQNYLVGSTWKAKKNISAFKAWGRYSDKFEDLKQFYPYFINDAWYTSSIDTFLIDNNKPIINAPLAILIGNETLSAAEDFLVFVNSIDDREITLIGDKTGGSTGEPLIFLLPGLAQANICSKRDTYPNGKDFVGVGIEPDIYVNITLQDFLTDNDPVINKAITVLSEKQSTNKNNHRR